MLPDILLKIKEWLISENLLQDSKIEKFINLLKYYKKGEWIYPGVLIRKLNISSRDAYVILEYLKSKGILQTNYEIYCHLCNKFDGYIYEVFNQVPETIRCEICNSELTKLDNTIVIYRVIDDGTKK